ncbi:acetylglutamate kinase [Chloroflexota bacterium]
MDKVIVIKIGGSTFGSQDTTIEDIVSLQKQGKSLLVVHGGGNLVNDWLARQGIPARFIHGERVTDGEMLEVVTAVLAGLANKEIVAAINNSGGRAAGISGVDGSLIQSQIKDAELGYVGAVVRVDASILEALVQAGYIPVVSPLGLHCVGKADNAPQLLNINGDYIAGEIAATVDAERLIFLTDVDGIRDKSGNLLSRLSSREAEDLITSRVAEGGMIPKIRACLTALSGNSPACIIDGRQPHALIREIEGHANGTTIYK